MKEISEILIKDLINQGIKTFFGVQGGACARLVKSVVKLGGTFHPVLNEQAAGYCAHGFYMAKKKPAGMIFTTGPGLINGLSGVATCFYDRVPTIILVGQVNRSLNIAKKTKTRMVGFQEVPHLDLSNSIADKTFKIDSKRKFLSIRKKLLQNVKKLTQVVEIPDDIQREKINLRSNTKIFKKTNQLFMKKKIISKKTLNLLKKANSVVFVVGSGFANSKHIKQGIKLLNSQKYKIAVTWGGQQLQSKISDNFLGLMGQHNPGKANNIIQKSDLIISLGSSLLQHQVGKQHDLFAPKANIIYVNSDINECKRAKYQFGKRLIYFCNDAVEFMYTLNKLKTNLQNNIFYNSKYDRILSTKSNTPVKSLSEIFKAISKTDSIIFADAGATLSWSYQAANLLKNCAPIYTAFNLHGMGYANCGAIGGARAESKNIYVVIGDGSIPMNSQELAWCKNFPVKFIIIDNKGYGIIRQTQKDFYQSNFLGSDFKNNKSKLPNFSIEKILNSFSIKHKTIKNNNISNNNINWLKKNRESKALIINTDYSARVNLS